MLWTGTNHPAVRIPPKSVNSQASTSPAVFTHNICVSYPGTSLQQPKQVLHGVDLAIPRGTLHMLLGAFPSTKQPPPNGASSGANGCGKSTLLRVLGGLLQPQQGSFHVDPPVGFVFQNPDNQVVMPTVAADVAFGLGRYHLHPDQVAERVNDALTAVNLAGIASRPCHTLSGGQKQRVAIAGVLAERPSVLLCDELTTFVDDEDQASVLQAVRRVVDASGAVTAVWVTHRLEELEYADAVSVMEDGRIKLTGSPREARAALENNVVG